MAMTKPNNWPLDSTVVQAPNGGLPLASCGDNNPLAVPAAETTARVQRGRPFQPGQSGNAAGRPKGAKHKLTEIFLSFIALDFAEHGADTIARLRTEDPTMYLKLIGSLIPRELILQRERGPLIDISEVTDEELAQYIDKRRREKFVQQVVIAME
jgi:hypothetical protein